MWSGMLGRVIEVLHSDLEIDNFLLLNFVNASTEELEMVREWRNHPDVRKWMYNQHEVSHEEHLRFVKALKDAEGKAYWIVKKGRMYLGVVYLLNIRLLHGHAYMGIYSNPIQRNKGVGKTLISLVVRIAFDFLNLHTLKLEVFETNERAINLYRKAGFREEGRLKGFVRSGNRWIDVLIMGMINPEEESKNDGLS